MTAMDDETQQSTKITIYTQVVVVVVVVVVVGIHCVYLVVVLNEERGDKQIELVDIYKVVIKRL
jgi:hypothetical protein